MTDLSTRISYAIGRKDIIWIVNQNRTIREIAWYSLTGNLDAILGCGRRGINDQRKETDDFQRSRTRSILELHSTAACRDLIGARSSNRTLYRSRVIRRRSSNADFIEITFSQVNKLLYFGTRNIACWLDSVDDFDWLSGVEW